MIDFQNAIFTAIATPLREAFPDIKVVSTISTDPAAFPCVQIEETENVPTQQDNGPDSLYAKLRYAVRIYSNAKNGRTAEARKILSVIDSVCEPLNMRRSAFTPASDLYNNTIYRISATYSVVVDKDGNLYRTR